MTLSFLAKSNFSIPAKPRSPSWLRVQILATPETRKKDPTPIFSGGPLFFYSSTLSLLSTKRMLPRAADQWPKAASTTTARRRYQAAS